MAKPGFLDIYDIIRQLEEGNLRIPDFQRGYIWTEEKVQKLLDSIRRGYPIGSFLSWKTNEKLKELDPLELNHPPAIGEKKYLLDGQQRAVTLYSVFKNHLKIGKAKIEYRVFYNLEEKDFILYKKNDLKYRSTVQPKIIPERHIVPLDEVILFESGKVPGIGRAIQESFASHPKYIQYNNALNDLFHSFRQPVGTEISVENVPLDEATEIFERMNLLGTTLTLFDIMVAKTYHDLPYFNLREKVKNINSDLDEKGYRLSRIAFLQMAAACLKEDISKHAILGTSEELQADWDSLEKTQRAVLDYVQRLAPVSKFLPYEVILSFLSYYFFYHKNRNPKTIEQLDYLFWEMGFGERYGSSQNSRIREDLLLISKEKQEIQTKKFSEKVTSKKIIEQELSLHSAFSKTLLCYYSTKKPRDFSNDQPVNLALSFATANEKQIHHIFPQKYLKKQYGNSPDYEKSIKPFVNSMANVCLISSFANKKIGHRAPSEYLSELELENGNLRETLKSHLISDAAYAALKNNEFQKFLKIRAKTIEEDIDKDIFHKS